MSLETMSFILGGIFLGAGLFGGGLEIRELKLPQIGTGPRVFAAVLGTAFVALAVVLNPGAGAASQKLLPAPPAPTPEPPKTNVVFQEPMLGDRRVDVCLEWAQKCGEPAATAWCKVKGMGRALDFPAENVGQRGLETRLVGTNEVCKGTFCSAFMSITCQS